MTRRKVEPGALDYKPPEKASGNTVRQTIALRQGVDADLARQLIREIKDKQAQGAGVDPGRRIARDRQEARRSAGCDRRRSAASRSSSRCNTSIFASRPVLGRPRPRPALARRRRQRLLNETPRPLRLEAQDTALSRRQHRFESGRGRQGFQGLTRRNRRGYQHLTNIWNWTVVDAPRLRHPAAPGVRTKKKSPAAGSAGRVSAGGMRSLGFYRVGWRRIPASSAASGRTLPSPNHLCWISQTRGPAASRYADACGVVPSGEAEPAAGASPSSACCSGILPHPRLFAPAAIRLGIIFR